MIMTPTTEAPQKSRTEQIIDETEREIIEKLAALEHKQWGHWTEHILSNLTPENIRKWKRQIKTPYSKLSEKEKDSDREWAIKVLKTFDNKLCRFNKRFIGDNCGRCDGYGQ